MAPRSISTSGFGRDTANYRKSGSFLNCSRLIFGNGHSSGTLNTPGSSPSAAKCHLLALILAMAAVVAAPTHAAVGLPIVTVYSSDDVGGDAQSFSAVQDEAGRMIFGVDGLLIYDGERWSGASGKSLHALHHLRFGSDGRLWAAAEGNFGWFERTTNQTWEFHSLLNSLPPNDSQARAVWRVYPGARETVFVAQNDVLKWDGKKTVGLPLPSSKKLFSAQDNGVLYVHHYPSGVYAVDDNGLRPFIPGALLKTAGVAWVEARDNGWFLLTAKGAFFWRGQLLEPLAPETSTFLSAAILTRVAPLPDGRYAVGTLNGGIAVLRNDGSLEQTLAEPEGLPTHSISSLFVDRDHQLWATSPSHIFRVDLSSDTEIFDQRSGLPSQTYYSIAKFGNMIAVGGGNGVYVLSDNSRSTATPILSEKVRALKLCGDELYAIGFKWVKRLDGDTAETIYQSPEDVLAISPSRRADVRIYLSELDGISKVMRDGPSHKLVRALPGSAREIVEDEFENLWVSTVTHGLFLAHPSESGIVDAIRVDGSMSLPALEGKTFVKGAANGSLFVFAKNGGWWKRAGESKFRAIENYPARDIVAASEFDDAGTGWIVHPDSDTGAACAARISFSGQEARWQPHSIAGLPEIGAPRSIFVETTSTTVVNLWIGGTKSVLRHVVKGGLAAPRPRPPILHGLSRNEESTAPQAITSSLPYSVSSIEFDFAAPEFLRRSSLRLQTRIDGIDSDWQPAERDSRRILTAVRDGNYTFRVRAVAETGIASEETVFKFQVLPPWWRSRLALAGEGAAAMLMLWGAYGWRVRALRRRNEALEEKVRQRTQEFEEASAAKTQFVANMSHDIRNPLNGIVGLALALENSKLDRRQREIVATLRECSTYLSSLVDDVLDFASIEAGRVELRPGPFVPQELLRSIVNTLKADADGRGALLLVEADPHLPPHILGDAGRIQQILVNFVSNALKYAGGQIRLSVSTPSDTFGEIEFAVIDEGPGISAEEQRTLFTKFTRVKRTQGHDIPGTGLGLAACRLLADLMGGSVGVESRAGEGARFFLRLPLEAATAPTEFPAVSLPNTTVLLVEDTDYNAWAAEAVLAKLGLACERARTGAEALQMFAAKRFNVVLLDRNLPDMDGTEVARQMRAAEAEGPQAVLLAVTAYCTAEDRALCLESGMDAFVGKPLTPEKLRRVLVEAGRKMLTAASFHVSAETPARASTPEIDVSLLRYLTDDTPESFDVQVQRFLAELREREAQIEINLRAADYRGLATSAHSLLGPAKMVGASALIEACQQLEAAADTSDRGACEQALRRVRDEVRAVTAAMQRHRSAPQST